MSARASRRHLEDEEVWEFANERTDQFDDFLARRSASLATADADADPADSLPRWPLALVEDCSLCADPFKWEAMYGPQGTREPLTYGEPAAPPAQMAYDAGQRRHSIGLIRPPWGSPLMNAPMKPGHPGELGSLLGAAADLRQRFKDLDVDHDIPDGLGCNTEGTIRYIDRDLFTAVVEGQVGTGLTPEQTIDCLVEHIEAEKSLKDHDNGVDHWADLSLLAHQAEAEKVASFGGNIDQYDRALAPLFIACKQKEAKNVPDDLMNLEDDGGEAQQSASGISRGGEENSEGAADQESGRSAGGSEPQGEPGSEA